NATRTASRIRKSG
ncbi:protein-P-II uridylyltransferase, partial [Vibrio parahaemolyticus VP2007-007]